MWGLYRKSIASDFIGDIAHYVRIHVSEKLQHLVSIFMNRKMQDYLGAFQRDFRVMFFLSVLFLMGFFLFGCASSENNGKVYFEDKITEYLKSVDSKVINASSLTEFEWDELCFERSSKLELIFSSNEIIVFEFDYEDYFVDEPYVEKSLAGLCVSYGDKIVVSRKYPGYAKTVEFLKH